MLKCDRCKNSVSKCRRVVVETREHKHPERRDARGNVIDNGGVGSQIVREQNACSGCEVRP